MVYFGYFMTIFSKNNDFDDFLNFTIFDCVLNAF